MATMSCNVFIDASEESINRISEGLQEKITDVDIDVDIEAEDAILIDEVTSKPT